MKKALVCIIVAAGLLAGCSNGSSSPATDTGTKVSTEPTPTSAAASSSSAEQTTYRFGDVVQTKLGNKVVVYGWDTNVDLPIHPHNGNEWSQIDVKYCENPDSTGKPSVGSDVAALFSLEMSDSTRVTPDYNAYRPNDLMGQYNIQVLPGDCDRGAVVFEVPQHQKPKYVVFSSSSVIKWAVS